MLLAYKLSGYVIVWVYCCVNRQEAKTRQEFSMVEAELSISRDDKENRCAAHEHKYTEANQQYQLLLTNVTFRLFTFK